MAASTSATTLSNEALLDNHLAFTALHRGEVQRSDTAIQIRSSLPGFTCVLPLAGSEAAAIAALLSEHNQARLLPWTPLDPVAIERHGYSPQGALSYMVLHELLNPTRPPALEIERVTTAALMRTFTETQVRGFGSVGEDLERWNKWLGEINLRNLSHPDQTFLIGRLDGQPVGVTLLVFTGKTAGIYAVATLPEFRKRGVSTALLNNAVAQARERSCTTICLQVVAGSYAQSLYRSLGFKSVFDSAVYARKASAS